MFEQIPEGFSWSASRARMFENCPRSYFFHYYLAMGNAVDADGDRAAQARRLRHLTSMAMWVGSQVHQTAENMLRVARHGKPVDVDDACDQLLARMRRDYKDSRDDRARQGNPKFIARFFEHEYERHTTPEQWKQAADDAVDMVRAFAGMEFLETLAQLPREDLMALEELQKWDLDGVPIWIRIDLAYRRDDGRIQIVDWKTGRVDTGENPLQMMSYATFASQRWSADPSSLDVREVYLRLPQPDKWCSIDESALDGAREQIVASIQSMLDALEDRQNNRARESDFPAKPTPGKCGYCFFRRICSEAAESDFG